MMVNSTGMSFVQPTSKLGRKSLYFQTIILLLRWETTALVYIVSSNNLTGNSGNVAYLIRIQMGCNLSEREKKMI